VQQLVSFCTFVLGRFLYFCTSKAAW
jgi:hypothetical protein